MAGGALNGRWKLVYLDNFEGYTDAIRTTAENKAKAMQLLTPENNIQQDISISGDQVVIKTITPVKTNEAKGTLNQEFDQEFLDGRKLKATFTLDGDTLTETQTGAFNSVNVRTVEGGQLVMRMTANGVTQTRKYDKV